MSPVNLVRSEPNARNTADGHARVLSEKYIGAADVRTY